MESGSTAVGREERKKKYEIYVEEYVLSYLRRESDSLELSEIFFYGSRQENGRRLYVYGAGRDKEIAAFAGYEPLSELVCRLTQAGPVFLIREPDGEYRITGFQIFYDNNEAMQNYLLEWTGSAGGKRMAEKSGAAETTPAPVVFPEEKKKRTPHGVMSVQLCLILVVLVAIVITSTDSYDKLEQLNRSAKEVFFAIENQEAGEATERSVQAEASGEAADDQAREEASHTVDLEEKKEITVERVTEAFEEEEPEQASDAEVPQDDHTQTADSEKSETNDTDGANDVESHSDTEASDAGAADTEASAKKTEKEEGMLKSTQEAVGPTDVQEAPEGDEEQNEEALSRSITRYYEVEQGDTLYTISQKIYGDISRVEKICEVNQISDPDKIRSGQRIILP